MIAILGAGKMGEALASGLLRAGVVRPEQIVAAARRPERADQLRDAYASDVPVVRVMSNTPVLVDEAMSVISPGPHAAEQHMRRAEELLRPVGKVLRIPESQQDAATALSGSGPAYVYFLVEAMVDAGILLGIPRATAIEMVTQAVFGV